MRTGTKMVLCAASAALVALWTGCTCDPVYPTEAGSRCSVGGDRACDTGAPTDLALNVLICLENLKWAVEIACDDFGMVCEEPDGEPMCVDRPCTLGETRCTPDYAQITICNAAAEWTPSEICEEGWVCSVEDDVAACVADTCVEGETRCSGDEKQVETCDAEGAWLVIETCPPGQMCELRIAVAICVEAERICSADTELGERCDPEDPLWIQECRNVGTGEDPAYAWVDSVDCSTMSPDYICQQVNDNAPFCLPPP